MNRPVIMLGGGGHARVLIELLIHQGIDVIGVTEKNTAVHNKSILGVPIIGDDESVINYSTSEIMLVNGIGAIGNSNKRDEVFNNFKKEGYSFYTVIHPSAVIAPSVNLGEGSQIMAGVVIQTGCIIGHNTIINTKASVDHDCIIAKNVHISPGVTLSGNVKVGAGAHIGTGAIVIQGIEIGEKSVIGAGAVVIKDIPSGVMACGVPAKVINCTQ